MDLLVYLAERPNEVLSHDQIFRDVWRNRFTGDSALQTAISALRKALGDNPRRPAIIETIPKRGYRLIAASTAPKPALAVLPFKDLSSGMDDEFFADGITDTLIAELGRVRALRVISRLSTLGYRGSDKSAREIARDLNARLIVEGSAMLSASRARITVQVIDAENDVQLMTETYESDRKDFLDLYRESAESIARLVSDRLRLAPEQAAADQPNHPDAQVAYLRGRHCFNKMTPESFQAALTYFQTAIDLDPEHAAAHAGVADIWGAFAYWGWQHPSASRDPLREAIGCAERINADIAEVQMIKGAYLFYYERDWTGAEQRFRRAIELNPNLAHARLLLSLFLATMRQPQATDEINLAARIDPLNPVVLLVRAMWLAANEHFDAALEELEQLLNIEPQHPPALQVRADIHWRRGSEDAIVLEGLAWSADPEVAALFANRADHADPSATVRKAARMLEERSASSYVQPRQIARLLVHGGAHDDALTCLEHALADDDLMQIDHLQLSLAFDPLRDHPRFRALLAALSLS